MILDRIINPIIAKVNNKFSLLTVIVFIISIQVNFGQEPLKIFQKGKEETLKGNETHHYQVNLNQGELLQLDILQKNVDIKILAISKKNDTIQKFDSPSGKNGLEIVELPISQSGAYFFKIGPRIPRTYKDSILTNFIKTINGSYQVQKFEILSKNEHNKLITFRNARKDSVISWIKSASIPLKSVKAETGLKDLSYLKPIFKDVQVVGLGETSHGTKEIFQMKHRMLEFLVKEMGFTIFAIEASHVGCRSINDYVLHGKGNSRDALSAQGFWVWNTEEVIDMIEWMRDYNMKIPEDKKIQFIGIDTQTNGLDSAYENVSAFIKKIDNARLSNVKVDSLFHNLKTIKDKKDMTSQRQELYTLLSYLVVNKIKALEIASRGEYENTISDLRKIIQGVEAGDRKLQRGISYNIRDEYMAQTVLEVLQKKGREIKMVLWAHNDHISKNVDSRVNGYKKPLGSVLKTYFGKKYYAIGFSTFEGSFQARNYSVKNDKLGKVASFKLYPAKEGSLDWYFEKSKKDIFFINFDDKPHSNAVDDFLNKKQKTNNAGANWTFEYSFSPTQSIEPEKFFDGMIFIKETSSAVLTPGGEKEIEKRLKNN
ncbi:erythromycin esterase family protein [Aquimarina sp. Aq78]|uniref:erythromycin esterase family protein n=1 Tax=Aquimarina sp. Aq78 TaxID=1191889 RepID=UPI000D0EE94C|nr:erythromycin esterase family protein [Aquimarina sp. Aq78]